MSTLPHIDYAPIRILTGALSGGERLIFDPSADNGQPAWVADIPIASKTTISPLVPGDFFVVHDTSLGVEQKISAADLRIFTQRPEVENESGTTRSLVAGDELKVIRCTNASGCTITVPTGLDVNFTCLIIRAPSAGNVELAAAVGVTLEGPASAASPFAVSEAGEVMGIMCVASDTYHVYGALA
jgi:hypothetical protein